MAAEAWIAGKILVLLNRLISYCVQKCVDFPRAARLTYESGTPDYPVSPSCHHGGAGPSNYNRLSHDRSPLLQVLASITR